MNYFTNRFAFPCHSIPSIMVLSLWALVLIWVPNSLNAQSMLKRISLSERVSASGLIVEGRIVQQSSYWKADSMGINTSHIVEVYKVLKGDKRPSQVQLITPGGQVGMSMEVVEPALKLHEGDVGLFFLAPLPTDEKTPFSDRIPLAYQPYSSLQGHIAYDELRGNASDPFAQYPQIQRDLYAIIAGQLGQALVPIRSYTLTAPRLNARATPAISILSPATISSGTQSELEIRGSNFGTLSEESRVYFANADNGGASFLGTADSHLKSWSDTLIVVEVPAGAGTGRVRVKNGDAQLGESETDLHISFAHMNVNTGGNIFRPFLANRDGEGGYTLQMSHNADQNGADFTQVGGPAFIRALETWQCATGVQFKLGEPTASTTLNPSNPPNLILFTNDENTLPAGVLGRTNSWFISCDGTTWLLDGFDILFRKSGTGGINWHFDESAPCSGCYDFETVALHELGHAHLLGHVIDPSHVMHYSVLNGVSKREPEPGSAILGATQVIQEKVGENLCFSFYPAMEPQPTGCEEIPPSIRLTAFLEGFLNPEKGEMHDHLSQRNLLPKSQPFAKEPWGHKGNESVSSIPEGITDWLLVDLYSPSDSQLVGSKAVFVRTTGTITDTEGNEYLHLEGVEPGDYFLGIHHPGHLSIYSKGTVTYSSEGHLYDFIQGNGSFTKPGNLKSIQSYNMMYAGDFNGDSKINNDDFNYWRSQRDLTKTYGPVDGDGDGQVNVHDANLWMRNRQKEVQGFKRF